MRATKLILTVMGIVALAFGGQSAFACGGQHMSVSGTGSNDTNCVFNVNVSIDSALTSAMDENTWSVVNGDWSANGTSTAAGEQSIVDNMASSIVGMSPGGTVNYSDGEDNATFTIPQGVQEVQITLTDQNGVKSTATDVVVNGKLEPAGANADPCGLGNNKPPVNTKAPDSHVNPADQSSAVDTQIKNSLPMNGEQGDNESNMTKRIK
jgi:hypothetical protein